VKNEFRGQLPARRTLWGHAVTASPLYRTSKLVALVLGTYMTTEARCWPSLPTVARDASVSKRTVERSIPRIEKAGLLVVSRQRDRRGNVYLGAIPPSYWPLLGDQASIDQWVEKGILGADEDYLSNGVTGVAVQVQAALRENGDISTPNGVTWDGNGDRRDRNGDTAVSTEVDEVTEAILEGPESLGGDAETFRGEADFVVLVRSVLDDEEAKA
jgi:hypothetical protein